MTTSGPQDLIIMKRFLSENDYLWTPKTNTAEFTAITDWRVVILLNFSENSGDFCENSKIFSKIFMLFWKKCENRVDLEKRGKMRPLSLSEVPILLKFD